VAYEKKYINMLFDVDGTLIDSNRLHARAWVEAFSEHGYRVEIDEVLKLIGMGGREIIPAVLGDGHEKKEVESISDSQKRIYSSEYLGEVQVIGNPASLFAKLVNRGSRVYLITSSYQELVDKYITMLQVAGLVSGYTTADDTQRAKPYPDLICRLLKDNGLEKHSSLMIGDSPYDVLPAVELDIPIIAVLSGGYSASELEGAAEIYIDLNEFEQKLQTSIAWE